MPRRTRSRYTQADYEGEFNIARHEKENILKAWILRKGRRSEMALTLHISILDLGLRITLHRLDEVFSLPDVKQVVLEELNLLKQRNIKNFVHCN